MYFGENCRWVPLIITVISAQFPGVAERGCTAPICKVESHISESHI